MKAIHWIGLVLGLCSSAFGQTENPAKPLSLKEAEEYAVRNHPRISVAELNALAARQATRAARSAYFPSVVANATAVGTTDDNTRIAAGGLNNPAIFDRNAEGLTVSQIITDFGRTANLAASAQLRQQAAEENTLATRAQLVLQVDTAYLGALASQSVLRVAEETVQTRKLLLDQVTALATNRLKSDLDVSFARVAFEEGRLLLSRAENNLKAARARLATLMGTPNEQNFQLLQEPMPPNLSTGEPDLVQEALLRRPELARLRFERDAALKFAKAERALRYPTLSAIGSVGVIPVRDDRLPDNYAAAGVNLSVPLFAGGLYSARQKEAELRARAAEESLRDQENTIVQEVRVALVDTQNAMERVRITDELLAQANLSFNLAQARFNIGSASIVELSQAQLNQTSAQIAQATARYEYQISRAGLDYQIGAK